MTTARPASGAPDATAASAATAESTGSDPLIRDATEADLPAIHAIYAHHVLTGVASFEEVPPSVDDLRMVMVAPTDARMMQVIAIHCARDKYSCSVPSMMVLV